MRQLGGGLSSRIQAARQRLIGLLAQIEATIDFSDEDVDEVDWGPGGRSCDCAVRSPPTSADGLPRQGTGARVRTAIVGNRMSESARC